MGTKYKGSGEPLQPNTVSPKVFKYLKHYVDRLLPHERIVVLTFNEFPFRDFVPMTPEGYQGNEKLPSHLLIPCIRFVVSKKFHFLGSLFFHTEYLEMKPDKFGKDISECIKLYILALQNIGLQVVATVCPLTATFHQAVVSLTEVPYMEDFDGPLFYNVNKNEEIVHFHDPKYVRDSFIRWFLLFDLEFKLYGKRFIASRDDITEGLRFDNKPPLLQKSTNNNKYYDQLSVYYFNENMSMSIRKQIKQGYLDTQAMGTSFFINMFRQIFNRLYGLNGDDCDKFDFSRVNEFIDFIISVRAAYSITEDYYGQEVAYDSPSTRANNSESNSELIALEKFVKDSGATPLVLYPQKEQPLDVIKNTNFKAVIIPTSSSKSIPLTTPAPSQKGTKKKKKKKKDKKKPDKSCDPSLQSNQGNETKNDKSNPKDDLLLLYQNPSQDPEDNGEFVLCTTKKYQEIQAQKAVYSDHSYAVPPEENDELDNNYWLYQMIQSDAYNQQVAPSNKLQQYEKKVLSPVQNISEMNVNRNIDQSTIQNSNLNENIRKYKNVNKINSSAVRKINLDDESNKENITKNFRSTIFEDALNVNTKKTETSVLNKEISYSISDPDNSTEYQFEQLNSIINIPEGKIEQTLKEPPFKSDDICKLAVDILHTYLSKDQVKTLLSQESSLENLTKCKAVNYSKSQGPESDEMLNEKKELTEPQNEDFHIKNAQTYEKSDTEKISTVSIQQTDLASFSQVEQIQSANEEIKLQSEMNIIQLDNIPSGNIKMNLFKISPTGIISASGENKEKINIKTIPAEDDTDNNRSNKAESVEKSDIKNINLKSSMNIVQLDNIPSGNIKMNIIKSSPGDINNERIDIKLVGTDCIQPPAQISLDEKKSITVCAEESLSNIYSQLNEKMDSLKINVESINSDCDQHIDDNCVQKPLELLSYSEPSQSVDDKYTLPSQFDNFPTENTKMNLVKISPSGIEKASGDISKYDPLSINKNTYISKNKFAKSEIDISYADKDKYLKYDDKFMPQYNTDLGENIKLGTSESYTERQMFSNSSSHYQGNISGEMADFPYSSNMELLADTSVNLASYAEVQNNSPNHSDKASSFQTMKDNDDVNVKTYGEIYPQYQEAFNTSTEDILSKWDLFQDYDIQPFEDVQTQPTTSTEQFDKCALSDFNSEFDDFDEIIMNKEVTTIINKLEEKDAQISKAEEQLDLLAPSTSNEQQSKRSFMKKEVTCPVGENVEAGISTRTVFHRDKTEDKTPTPKTVIKKSENICDKSKIASTKAKYSKTFRLLDKRKKQFQRMREEQYKKVANTICQAMRSFPDVCKKSNKFVDKGLWISKASLQFVYDLMELNEVSGLDRKQKIVDKAYNKLCLSILGKNIKNAEALMKMNELMPVLQDIAVIVDDNSEEASELLADYISKASFSKEIPRSHSQVKDTFYVREDVPNLWINNIKGMEKLFRRLGAEKVYFELSPELFNTEHVVHMINFIQVNGPAVELFPLDERCLPINLLECFNTLKPCGSVLLVEK